jgi:hypothetical protein
MTNRPQHPSGKPIVRTRVVGRSIWRIPDKGPVIPRLQEPSVNTNAIGFLSTIAHTQEDECE